MIGYGNAIHHFKDYVIRGELKYGEKARQAFAASSAALAQVPTEDHGYQQAVSDIDETIERYQETLPVITRMVAEHQSAEKVDSVVIANGHPARKGFALLRSK